MTLPQLIIIANRSGPTASKRSVLTANPIDIPDGKASSIPLGGTPTVATGILITLLARILGHIVS